MVLINVRTDADVSDFVLELILADLVDDSPQLLVKSPFCKHISSYVTELKPFYSKESWSRLFEENSGCKSGVAERSLVRYVMEDFLNGPIERYFLDRDVDLMGVAEHYGIRSRALDLTFAVSLIEDAVSRGFLDYIVLQQERKQERYVSLV